jgi:hypothetical protein
LIEIKAYFKRAFDFRSDIVRVPAALAARKLISWSVAGERKFPRLGAN